MSKICIIGDEHKIDISRIKNGDVIIDAGGSHGESLKDLSNFMPKGLELKVICIEPSVNSLEFLEKEVERAKKIHNKWEIFIENKCLCGSIGSVDFIDYLGKNKKYHKWSNAKGLYLSKLKNNEEILEIQQYKSEAIDLKFLVEKYNIDRIAYLKMDIEGSEFDVIDSFLDKLHIIDQMAIELHNECGSKDDLENTLCKKFDHVEVVNNEVYAYQNIQVNFNRQPYVQNEVKDGRTLEFVRKNMVDFISSGLKGRELCLDVGCGNGRMNIIWSELFEKVICIDPVENIFEEYMMNNCLFFKKNYWEFDYNSKFDSIIFWGSHNVFNENFNNRHLERAKYLMKDNGVIVIMCENFQSYNFPKEFLVSEKTVDKMKIYILEKQR